MGKAKAKIKKIDIKVTIPRTYVAHQLVEKADLFDEKDKQYGKNYLIAGNILMVMFPDGLLLSDAETFNRFALFNQMLNKIMRYGQNLEKGGHDDSLDDLSVYAMMTKEADHLFKVKK